MPQSDEWQYEIARAFGAECGRGKRRARSRHCAEGDCACLQDADTALRTLRALLDAGGWQVVPRAPTEAMVNEARQLFLFFAMAPTMKFVEHLKAGGWSPAAFTPEQLKHRGHFPKDERAAMVFRAMLAAAPSPWGGSDAE